MQYFSHLFIFIITRCMFNKTVKISYFFGISYFFVLVDLIVEKTIISNLNWYLKCDYLNGIYLRKCSELLLIFRFNWGQTGKDKVKPAVSETTVGICQTHAFFYWIKNKMCWEYESFTQQQRIRFSMAALP